MVLQLRKFEIFTVINAMITSVNFFVMTDLTNPFAKYTNQNPFSSKEVNKTYNKSLRTHKNQETIQQSAEEQNQFSITSRNI